MQEDFEPGDIEPTSIGTCTAHDNESSQSSVFARYIVGFIMLLRKKYFLSDTLSQQLILFLLFSILGAFSALCKGIASLLPSSLYKMNQSPNYQFKRYVVCKKCHQIFYFNDCILEEGGQRKCKTCPYVEFPNHKQERMRMPCGARLLVEGFCSIV